MKYLSVCSGIEAATVAWHPLGWEPLAFSEIEAFPRKVLAHHYPDIPCHGDFTVLRDQDWIGDADLLVGGTPCQAFSVAGLRQSLSDDRGNLTLEFVRLADAIDNIRHNTGRKPAIIVWENVPGVLSVKDNAFGCFLAALVGNDSPLVPTGGKWTNAGLVIGPKRSAAWRILDAQYFGVAQRRRRVFVVAGSGNGFDPAEVLFEREGVRRDTAPSREKREEPAKTITRGVGQRYDPETESLICGTLSARTGLSRGVQDAESGHMIASSYGIRTANTSSNGWGIQEETTHTLDQAMGVAVAQTYSIMPMNSGKDYKARPVEISQPLMAGGPVGGNQGGDFVVQPVAFNARQNPDHWTDCTGTLDTDGSTQAVAVGTDCYNGSITGDVACTMGTPGSSVNASGPTVMQHMAVRRLTPIECERLQGFPDDYTAIPNAADGPRYKALGNSMAVPVMRWIGQRINMFIKQ